MNLQKIRDKYLEEQAYLTSFLEKFGDDLISDREDSASPTELSENELKEGIDSDEDQATINRLQKEKLDHKKLKKSKINEQFLENTQSTKDKKKLFKKILSLGYEDFFSNGFKI